MNGRTLMAYRFIKNYTAMYDIPPKYDEIAQAIGVSGRSVVSYHVDKLVEMGLAEKTDGKRRTVHIIPK